MIRVRQIKVPLIHDQEEVLLERLAHKVSISSSDIHNYRIVKKSIDARDKNNIFLVYEVDFETSLEEKILKRKNPDIIQTPDEEYHFSVTGEKKCQDVVVIGEGPSGLFSAYLLAEAGFHPIILERGEKIEDRIKSVEKFFQTNQLNPNSNVQFGEGGAGTFSDGKLNTLVKDKKNRGKKVFEIFVENGAPEEILYLQKPHIGTDLLRKVMIQMREKICQMGGEIHYSSLVTKLLIEENRLVGVEVNHHDILPCEIAILSIGHSARDTFSMLRDQGFFMKPKNFAVGLRMEHPQKMINQSQYGEFSSLLPPASYKLTYQTKAGRGVYSFCMCPGGFVVNASSEEGRLAVNGMSNYQRDEKNANSAIVVTVSPKDFGEDLFSGMEFQRKLEEKAYQLGKGFIPVQTYQDYCNNQISSQLGEVTPNTKGNTSFANLRELFPEEINQSILEALPEFGKKIHGFDRGDALLYGVESRTSSPVMIERNEMGESNIQGVYPCGEGAGYAGGITTAAMDGIFIAECIAKVYHP